MVFTLSWSVYSLALIKPQNGAKKVIHQRQGSPSSHQGDPNTARVSSRQSTDLLPLPPLSLLSLFAHWLRVTLCMHAKHTIIVEILQLYSAADIAGSSNSCSWRIPILTPIGACTLFRIPSCYRYKERSKYIRSYRNSSESTIAMIIILMNMHCRI